MNRAILSLLTVAFLTGCAVGPDYKRPVFDTPASWRVEEKAAQDTANTAWWHQFEDGVLDGLIDEALKQNNDQKENNDPYDFLSCLFHLVPSSRLCCAAGSCL